ncbi:MULTISPECIES: hypothetical protein [Nitrosopumilus]|uniref:Uncharacterized protein n=1 Tax=Nitrosopumilus piranensis TaxID=1582439 RepID=A0A0C5BW58_9ARCH|nr:MULTISPECIES: hypothetical protein [Nitrosopumilus]AJM92501.1 hypothetical protein NPIRD3C_1289 [Nitrosopumilus piranensis]
MHCDDKRTLFVLKQGIEETWESLKKSDFTDEYLIKKLNNEIQEYFDYRKSS